jgi:hypothetical protein
MVILSGITTSWARNPPEEWLFGRELPAHRQAIHRKKGYYAGNYQLRDEESTRGMGFHRKLPAHSQEINSDQQDKNEQKISKRTAISNLVYYKS